MARKTIGTENKKLTKKPNNKQFNNKYLLVLPPQNVPEYYQKST